MEAVELRRLFLEFFREKGHTIIKSSSLLPENDPTVLFTTAGMHPLVPYLLGEKHPGGKRLANVQKCVRTGDIDEVGDNRHLTFFEMLGNWSLGDYWKKEAIEWSWEFLTSKKYLGLDTKRLYVTVFEGDNNSPRDDESIKIWQEVLKKSNVNNEVRKRVFLYSKEKNWWGPAGQTGPCGPDTEMFFDTLNDKDLTKHKEPWTTLGHCHPNCDCGRYIEIWNDVFMQYFKNSEGKLEPLKQRNVDTGMGLERTLMIMNGKKTPFETELFLPIIEMLEELSGRKYEENRESMRIIADHIKAASFMMADGVSPSNVEQGYILRRLIRRAVRYGKSIGISTAFIQRLCSVVIDSYSSVYHELKKRESFIRETANKEEERFSSVLEEGMGSLEEKMSALKSEGKGLIETKYVFDLFQSHGFPPDLTREILQGHGIKIDMAEFKKMFEEHQKLSRAGAEQKFAGGLADHSERVVRMHTATHLLHQALRNVLGNHVYQKGSNITQERLRFDFSHPQKMTPEEIKKVEEIVNEQVSKDLQVHFEFLTVADAKKLGAIGLFEDKYAQLGDKIKVYFVGDDKKGFFSKEICGGPHVKHTGEVGKFKIVKEEAVSAGVRRIKAIVE